MNSNKQLVQHLINRSVLHSSNIIDAFNNVDRVDFVANANSPDTYEDHPLPIGHGQTISQPTTVAMMMEMLSPQEGDSVLDIGSGSGWTTALLSFIVGKRGSVIGLERIPSLVEFGNNNLAKYNFPNSKIHPATKDLGISFEKFDRILVSAAASQFPVELTNQLKIGGKLVIPVKSSIFEVTKKDDNTLKSIEHFGFTFVPLIY